MEAAQIPHGATEFELRGIVGHDVAPGKQFMDRSEPTHRSVQAVTIERDDNADGLAAHAANSASHTTKPGRLISHPVSRGLWLHNALSEGLDRFALARPPCISIKAPVF